jgi:hypothetical protein
MTSWSKLKNKLKPDLFPYAYDIYFSLYSENKRYSKIRILLSLIKSILSNIILIDKNTQCIKNDVLFMDTKHYPVFSNFQYFEKKHDKEFCKLTLEDMGQKNEINIQKRYIDLNYYFVSIKDTINIYKRIVACVPFDTLLSRLIVFLIIYRNLILFKKFNTICAIQKLYFGHNSSTLVSLIYHFRKDIDTITIQHGLPVETYFPIQSKKYLIWDEYSLEKFRLNGVNEKDLILENCPRFDIYKHFKKQPSESIRITYFTQINSPEVSTDIQIRTLVKFAKKIRVLNKIKFYVRPHPSDNIKLIKESLDDIIDYNIKEDDIINVFSNTDVAVSLYSTVLYEAKMLNIRTIQIYLKNENYSLFDFVDLNISDLEDFQIVNITGDDID